MAIAEEEIITKTVNVSQPTTFRERLAHMSRRQLAIVVAGVVFVLATTIALWWYLTSIANTDDATITGHVHQLGSKVSGTVLQIAVDDNQHVQAGQLLLKLDPKDYEIAAENARAAAQKAELQASQSEIAAVSSKKTADANKFQALYAQANTDAGVSRARAALTEAQSAVVSAQAQIEQREAELRRAKADFTRYEELLKERAVTKQSFDQMRENDSVGQANLQASKANLEAAKMRVAQARHALMQSLASIDQARGIQQTAAASVAQAEGAESEISVQHAAARQAEAQYENALTQLSYTDVVAPVSGKVGHRTVEVGQQIERGQMLLSIVSDEKWVVANFKETDMPGMRPGQKVDIKVDAVPDKIFTGKVDSFSPASGAQFTLLPPDNASGNFTKVVQRIPVKIVFDSNSIKGYENILAPGMSVEVDVHKRG